MKRKKDIITDMRMVQNLTNLRGIWTILKVEKMRLTTMHRRSNEYSADYRVEICTE
jgi:hypothetical protein